MSEQRWNVSLASLLIVLAVILRLLPHPANFAPVTAIALFGGSVLPRKLALWVPLLVMMLSDAFIGFYNMAPVIWACYAAIAFASNIFLREFRVFRTIAAILASSLFFFVVTNFAVWISSGMYVHTWFGLTKCYVLALPFFRNTLASDAIYTTALFGVFIAVRATTHRFVSLDPQKS
ncbi:MAG TPA: DUF6580 family putative transport protein [Candidatus Saccharimonadia bacterium]|nr:DUF6580 family putative transport protein [Candidatus Saccharimonadia bacterium]